MDWKRVNLLLNTLVSEVQKDVYYLPLQWNENGLVNECIYKCANK